MAIVAKKKAAGVHNGTAWMPKHTRCAWLLIAVLCVVAAVWLGVRGRDIPAEPREEPREEPIFKPDSIVHQTPPHDFDYVSPSLATQEEPVVHDEQKRPHIPLPDERGEPADFALSHTGAIMRVSRQGITPGQATSFRAPVFDNPTELFLQRYAGSNRHPIMLMPRFGADAEEELRRILATDIVIYDDDDEETVADKEAVAALKQELLAAVSEGYSASDVLNEMREYNNQRIMNRMKMQRELNSLLNAGEVEAALDYFEEANSQLAGEWLPPLEFDERKLPRGMRPEGDGKGNTQ